ncbi:histidine phosphatase family protein [Ramlibacter montanisoli]|uniref:Histidine phosphatase family protein n=1 Tax=Ramlibacter montanisoli TaxID=2732512 RepID=A0A849KL62_9BURK|nr:histidine phosphatase family protein [Ramlibacter montanisoli]NNU45181.1 histidine phosphatase family protein [Ramlibacter montanisoli]
MGTLYLVRHGQASFGADDYDQLSELGRRQSVRLGEYFAERGIRFDGLIAGTLRRHKQTLEGILEGMNHAGEPLSWEGLNEYDSEAVIATVHEGKLAKPTSPELYRHHFRLLRDGLARWMAGATSPRGMPSYTDFVAGVAGALDHVRANHYGQNVLVVTSGGPISTAVGHVLGTKPEVTIDLNMRIRNTAITEFAFTPKRHMLVGFNAVPHLDAPQYKDWVTYA